jgi:hypothetical protein
VKFGDREDDGKVGKMVSELGGEAFCTRRERNTPPAGNVVREIDESEAGLLQRGEENKIRVKVSGDAVSQGRAAKVWVRTSLLSGDLPRHLRGQIRGGSLSLRQRR